MSDKKLAILGLVAVIMTGAAVLQSRISNRIKTAEFRLFVPPPAGPESTEY